MSVSDRSSFEPGLPGPPPESRNAVEAPPPEGAPVQQVVFRGRWSAQERDLVARTAGPAGEPDGLPDAEWYGALWVCVRQEAAGRALYAAHRRGDCDVVHAATAGALARAMRRRHGAPPTRSTQR